MLKEVLPENIQRQIKIMGSQAWKIVAVSTKQ
jgi:hypothetical protein